MVRLILRFTYLNHLSFLSIEVFSVIKSQLDKNRRYNVKQIMRSFAWMDEVDVCGGHLLNSPLLADTS